MLLLLLFLSECSCFVLGIIEYYEDLIACKNTYFHQYHNFNEINKEVSTMFPISIEKHKKQGDYSKKLGKENEKFFPRILLTMQQYEI